MTIFACIVCNVKTNSVYQMLIHADNTGHGKTPESDRGRS